MDDPFFFSCRSPRTQAAGAARLVGSLFKTGAPYPRSGRLCVELAAIVRAWRMPCFLLADIKVVDQTTDFPEVVYEKTDNAR